MRAPAIALLLATGSTAAVGVSAFVCLPNRLVQQQAQRPGLVRSKPFRTGALLASTTTDSGSIADEEYDVVVIGSGVGGLCAAAVAATYGLDVAVVESHVHAGGAAHAFERDGFTFDSGPSLFSGLSQDRSPNPLKHVLDFIGEKVEWTTYDTWGVILPEGAFDAKIGPEPFMDILAKYGGPNAFEEWKRLMARIAPLSEAAQALPPAFLRNDAGVVLTMAYFLRAVLKTLPAGPTLQAPFSAILLDDVGVTDPFIKNWLSLLCFLLQGMPPEGTMNAVMAYMLADWYRPNVVLDYPKGGGGALIDALARGVTKRGGKVHLGAHVQEIMLDSGANKRKPRATGVRLKNGRVIKARKAVISNASIWNTQRLLPDKAVPEWAAEAGGVAQTESFLHLHVGIDAAGLEGAGLNCHYALVDDWSRGITAPGNVIIVSIPSLLDPSLAPPGCHTIHAYTAGNEPYSLYEGPTGEPLDRKSPEYQKVKAERSEILWRALEKIIPDVRSRVKVGLEGTPLTHERFLRRDRGTYGPKIRAGMDQYPSNKPPVEGLWLCGDSVFPGIGMPAVAASGTIAANNLVGVRKHFELLKSIRM